MKRTGIINSNLAGSLGRLGHTDLVVVCDAGLPIPPGPAVVDLSFRFGVPAFETVHSGLLEELVVEGAIAAEEVENPNPTSHELLKTRLPDLALVSHEELKRMVAGAAPGRYRRGHALHERYPPLRGAFLTGASTGTKILVHAGFQVFAGISLVKRRPFRGDRSTPAGRAQEEDQPVRS